MWCLVGALFIHVPRSIFVMTLYLSLFAIAWCFGFALSHMHALHILYRYARCMTKGWRTWCWNQPKGDVGERIQKMGGPREYMSGKRCSPSEYHLTNTDLVLNPRQAPEHSKPPTSLLKYTWVYILYCALSIGAELKSLLHVLPCLQYIYLYPY